MQLASGLGSVLTVLGSVAGGKQAEADANYEARQYEQNAGQQRAAAQRAAAEERRQARLANSRAQAVAGGGGGDESVVRAMADIAGEGEYRALTSIYEGEDRARGLQAAAASRRAQGSMAKRAGYFNAVSTIFKDGPGLYEKYGRSGPNYPGDGLSQGDRRKIGVY